MRIGLVSYRCENKNIAFNLSQIERALKETVGKVDLLCFAEAYLQGFDSLCWDFEADKEMAVSQDSEVFGRLRELTLRYGTALLFGYIERDGDRLYSSCAVLADGEAVHNYRRISRGWKEFDQTDEHYCEGTETGGFRLHGVEMTVSLCGDMFDYPERFRTDHLLIWPVYVSIPVEDWEDGALDEYAAQAALAAPDVLMINALDRDPVNHGGSFRFRDGKVTARTEWDREQILITEAE